MPDARKRHWEAVYTTKSSDRVSWYRPHLDRSLRFIEDARLPKDAAILDVVTSANVACGFHAGDPLVMSKTVALAKANGVPVLFFQGGIHSGEIDGKDAGFLALRQLLESDGLRQVVVV